MAQLTPRFSASRAVSEYTSQHYLPAASNYHERSANNSVNALKIVDWQRSLTQNWRHLRFGDLTVISDDKQYAFTLQLFLGDIDPGAIGVELFADAIEAGAAECHTMHNISTEVRVVQSQLYQVTVPQNRPHTDYTPRVIPYSAGVAIPLECQHILWQQ
jgi:starch phosphorylase